MVWFDFSVAMVFGSNRNVWDVGDHGNTTGYRKGPGLAGNIMGMEDGDSLFALHVK